tara:strand:- start:34 stop:432 length:399 start_codon:yes stop_codon:yes gene_type:complete
MKIYSGIFFNNGLHMTWDYGPGDCGLPHDIIDGKESNVIITGGLFNRDIGFLTCERAGRDDLIRKCYPTDTQRGGKTPLHITLYTAHSVSPVQSGILLEYMTQKQRDILLFSEDEQYTWSGRWGYFEEEKED